MNMKERHALEEKAKAERETWIAEEAKKLGCSAELFKYILDLENRLEERILDVEYPNRWD